MKEEKFRCHPSIIVEKSGGVFIALFFMAIPSLNELKEIITEGVTTDTLLILGIALLVLVIVLIYNILVWSKTFINIEENTIVIQRNTINTKVNTFGIKNISNINLEQNIFEKIIGTYKIKIDTDSLSTADKTDIEILLSKKEAYEFKNKIISLMKDEKSQEANESNIKVDSLEDSNYFEDEKIEYDIVYSVNDLLKHCFYNLSSIKIIFNLAIIAFVIYTSVKLEGIEGLIAIGILLITSCISILKVFIGDLFKYYNFSIKREEDKLHISYGLFKFKKFTVPIDRINAINIKQPLMSRIFKRYQSDIVTIGVGDDISEGSQILLSSNKDEFIKNMKILLPEINMEENLNLEREAKNHHIIKIIEMIIGLMCYYLIVYFIYKFDIDIPSIVFVVINFGIFLVFAVFYYLSYITCGFYMGEKNISISWGVFAKKISIIKYNKIQYINVRESPISTKLGLCRGEIYILASLGNSIRPIGYYNNILFEKLKEKIL